jgi:hypothetical protein
MKGTGAVPEAPLGPEQEALGPVRKKTRPAKSARLSGKQDVCERSRPQSEERSILDERVPGLIFDSLATVQAAIVSASKEMPYGALRQAMALGEQEKRELTSAARTVAAKYPAFFAQHKDGLEFVAALMAINAAKIDQLLSLIDQSDGPHVAAEPSPSEGHVCSARAALGIALIVLAPLGFLAVLLIVEHLRRKSYVH